MSGVKGCKVLTYEESHKIIGGELYKICTICKNWFPCTKDNFYSTTKNTKYEGFKVVYSTYCKTCEKARNIEYFKKHREQYSKNSHKCYIQPHIKAKYIERANKQRESGYNREWERNNPDKVKEYREIYSNKKHTINNKEWISCKQYFNNQCAYCGLPIEEHYFTRLGITKLGDLHKEHVDCNGEGDLSNCVPACKKCNCGKHKDNMEEWYGKQEFFNELKLKKIYKWLNEDYEQYIIEKKPRKPYTHKNKEVM